MAASRQNQIQLLVEVLTNINTQLIPAMIIQQLVDTTSEERTKIREMELEARAILAFIVERTSQDMVDSYYGDINRSEFCSKCGEVKNQNEECECEYLNRE